MILVVDFIKKHNGIQYATQKMNEFRSQAFDILNSLNANPIHKKQLNLLVNFVIDRNVYIMKVKILDKQISLVNENNIWMENPSKSLKIVKQNDETLLLITPNKVYTITCLNVNHETKTLTLLYNGNKFNASITEPIDEILKSMGLENALTPKISDMKAPMPGLVLQVLVNAGDTVNKGDKILVLEAMKMENAIKSPTDGIVNGVLVSQGMAVDKNQVLITFK
jgi:biotin carboxyl carrier protein